MNETRFYDLWSLLRRVIRTGFREDCRGSSAEEGRVGRFVGGENEGVCGDSGTVRREIGSIGLGEGRERGREVTRHS